MEPNGHMTTEQVGRRIVAARAIAGIGSVDRLAYLIGRDGFGARTLRKVESGEREASEEELLWIATACGLPFEFFTQPFERMMSEPADEILHRIEHALAGLAWLSRPNGSIHQLASQ